jgi:hypothetical protein
MDADKVKVTFAGCLWRSALPSTRGFTMPGKSVLRTRRAENFSAKGIFLSASICVHLRLKQARSFTQNSRGHPRNPWSIVSPS